MPPVDFQPGRAASGLGGGDNGGWEPDRGHGKEVTRSHEKKEMALLGEPTIEALKLIKSSS